MKLHRLHLRNFRQHGDSEIRFPADGVIGLVGANESGKSSLIEAIAWALYGSRATRGTKSSLRWNRAPARHVASATLDFGVGGRRYQVARSENSAELFDVTDGARAPIADGTSAVDAYVPQLVGMSLDELRATYLTEQRDLSRLNALGPTERRQFVLRVMGLDRIDSALKACRARRNDLQREREGLAAGLGERAPLDAEIEAAKAALRAAVETRTAARATLRDREAALGDAEARLANSAEARKRFDELTRIRDDAARRADASEAARDRARAELEQLAGAEARVVEAEARVSELPALKEERDRLAAARERWQERERLQARDDELDTEIALFDLRLEGWERDCPFASAEAIAQMVADRDRHHENLARLRESRAARGAELRAKSEAAGKAANVAQRKIEALTKAGAEGACPTCQRALGEHLATVVADLERERDELLAAEAEAFRAAERAAEAGDAEQVAAAEVRKLADRIGRAREQAKEIDAITQQRSVYARDLAQVRQRLAQLKDATFDEARFDQVTAAIAELEPVALQLERDRAAAERIPGLRSDLAEAEHARDLAAQERDAAEQGRAMLGFDPTAHNELVVAVSAARTLKEEASVAAARAESDDAAAQERHGRAVTALESWKKRAGQLTTLDGQLQTHTAAAERLDAFRVAQASLIRPELEELTTGFVAILTDGRHDAVSISEDFDVTLHESGLAAEVVSGGTEDVAAIALRLAISQMVAERAGHPLSLLVLDEPFGSLDEVRRGNVLNLIRRLGSVFQQVIVISHVAETKDAVDHVIEVEFDEATGRSKVLQPSRPVIEQPVLEAVPA